MTTHPEPLRIGGLGLPMLDCISPMNLEFKEGIKLIQAAQASDRPLPIDSRQAAPIIEMRQSGIEKIIAARHALADFCRLMHNSNYKIGAKATLDEDQNKEAARCFGIMQEAARQINVAAEYLDQKDKELKIRHLGSTTANKMSAVKAAMGDAVETHLLGLLGDEDDNGNRARVEKEMTEAGIQFHDFSEAGIGDEKPTLGNMAVGYIYQGSDDRTALKSPTPLLDKVLKADGYEAFVRQFTQRPFDMYLMEATDFSPKKFGARLFTAFSDEAIASKKPIMLGLPTDTKLILDPKADQTEIEANRARVNGLIHAPNTLFIGSNEEEAVALLCHQPLSKDKITAQAQIDDACNKMQEILKEKAAKLPEGSVEPVAFISNGVKGVYAITPGIITFVPGKKNPNLANNIGAGDGLFGGSLVDYIKRVMRPEEGVAPITTFSEEHLHEMFTLGQAVAHEVVGQKGAQLSQEKMLKVVYKNVPTQGQFGGIDDERERGIAA